jgi:dihydrofolate reductase
MPIRRRFIIGGVQMYRHVLSHPLVQASFTIDRTLMTRTYHPKFSRCDVFMPEFRSSAQITEDVKTRGHSQSKDEMKDSTIDEDLQDGAIEGGAQARN